VSTPTPDDRATRQDDAPLIPDRSADDTDTGWGDRDSDSNDDRLLRDVPPHW
jgi:hypothetical protein